MIPLSDGEFGFPDEGTSDLGSGILSTVGVFLGGF
jgi:hypothetical protein